MIEKVIRIEDLRRPSTLSASLLPALVPWTEPRAGGVLDTLGRPLRDLRISVTDRCNFRCTYCMPKEIFDKRHSFLPHSSLLSFEEITRLATAFVANGITKIRLTGGEPLLRKNIEVLIEMLSALRTPDGKPLDLTLTTNGSLLKRKAAALAEAGLRRVTISLDGLDDAVFRRMNDVDFPVADVLEGIDAALSAGLGPVKVNMVVKRGTNDAEIVPMARHFKGTPVVLRFIEYMDVGATNGWRMDDVLSSADVAARIGESFAIEPIAPNALGETAARWRYTDGSGEIGFISSVTQAFCHDCNRARLSTEGKLFTCLFGTRGHDLRGLLRGDHDDAQLAATIAALWQQRGDRYSELRESSSEAGTGPVSTDAAPRVEMHYIGG